MAIPDYETLMLPVLKLTAEGIGRVPGMTPRLAAEFGLTEEELSQTLPSGRTPVLASRAHWARTYMVKAGLVRRVSRGVCEITEEGRRLLQSRLERVDNQVLSQYPQFAEWKARSSQRKSTQDRGETGSRASAATPREQISAAVEEITADVADELLTRLLEGSPSFFEKAVVRLLTAMGYGGGDENAARRVGRSGDGGVDGVIDEDALGLDAVYVQAKRYAPANTVGRPAIQQFVGSLSGEGASKGVFVTTSSFSADAAEFLRRTPHHRIRLINGQEFARLMIKHGIGVRPVQTIIIPEIDENFFAEE